MSDLLTTAHAAKVAGITPSAFRAAVHRSPMLREAQTMADARTPLYPRTVVEAWRAATPRRARKVAGTITTLVLAAVLTACGGETTGTTVEQADAPAQRQAVEATETASPTPVETEAPASETVDAAPIGEAVTIPGKGTMTVSQLEPSVFAVEVRTTELQWFDGTVTAIDSTGVEHVGEMVGERLGANGYGGDRATFSTADVVTVTYTEGDDQVAWSVR